MRRLTLIALCLGMATATAALPATAVAGERCPSDAGPSQRQFDTDRLVGLRVSRARDVAAEYGCTVRVVKRNGRSLPVTADYSTSRVNVVVRDRRIRRVSGVG